MLTLGEALYLADRACERAITQEKLTTLWELADLLFGHCPCGCIHPREHLAEARQTFGV